MSGSEHSALLDGADLYHEVGGILDARTVEILEHRRKTAVVRRRGWLVRRMLLAADLSGLVAAWALTGILFMTTGPDMLTPGVESALFAATLPLWVVAAKIYGLYDHDEERASHTTADDFFGVFHLVTLGTWISFAAGTLSGLAHPRPAKLVLFWLLAIGLITVARASARSICRRRIAYLQNAVIVGAGDVGQIVARKILKHPEYGINLVGFVDEAPRERRDDLDHLTLLGPPDRLDAIVRVFDVERVIIAFSNEPHERTIELVRSLKDKNVQVDIVPRLFEVVGPGVGIHSMEGLTLIGLPHFRLSPSSRLLKRTLDLVLASLGLLVLAPFLAFVAIRIKLDSPGPVLYSSTRVGARGTRFGMYKFRTMVADADERKADFAHLNIYAASDGEAGMFKIPDDPRVTPFGRFLRRHSLDELPQLLNVLRGQMSLVGPRPLLLEEEQFIHDWARKQLDVQPGMTGIWQVSGRNSIPVEEKINLDYQYVTTWSLWQDLRLLALTLPVICGRVSAGY